MLQRKLEKELALNGGAPPAADESDKYEEDVEESEPIASINGIFINFQLISREKHAAWKLLIYKSFCVCIFRFNLPLGLTFLNLGDFGL